MSANDGKQNVQIVNISVIGSVMKDPFKGLNKSTWGKLVGVGKEYWAGSVNWTFDLCPKF